MGNLNYTDVRECDALPQTATVVAVNQTPPSLDIEIGETVHEGVEVHYHCEDGWKEHSHPHSTLEQEQMISAFEEGDEVLVLCDDEGDPVYVTGFKESPKQCRGYFIFPSLTKIGATNMYDESGDPATPNQSAEGAFVGLIPGGGEGSTDHGFWRATFSVTGYQTDFTLYVNDIEISEGYWDTEEHLELTGAPTTWRLEGYNWYLISIAVTQQGYDEYEVEYPTVEFGWYIDYDWDFTGILGKCSESESYPVNGNAIRKNFSGNLRVPILGSDIPKPSVTTVASVLHTLFQMYAIVPGVTWSQAIHQKEYVHHGYMDGETCEITAPYGYYPLDPFEDILNKWQPGRIGWGRDQGSGFSRDGQNRYQQFQFGLGGRVDLISDILECWDCTVDIDTTEYFVGDNPGDLLWIQPFSVALWGLGFQVEDTYLEELFDEHDLDLQSGDIEVDMTLPEELFGAM